MENIDNWEKLTNEQVGVYLSDKRDSINVSQYADGTDTRYQYETGVQNQNPHQYLGKIKHKYQDIHRNPLSTFSRNAWNGLLQLPEGIGEEAINLGELVDVKLLRAFGGDEEFEKRLNAGATALRQKLKHWFDTYQFENSERIKENKFVADLGQGTGSLFAALGLTLATKSPNAAAGVFGISQAGNLTSEMRERGVDIDKANQVGILGGAIEGKLEQFGLHLWIENYATKKLGTFLAKQGLVEFTQEASQTAAEETLMRTLGERKDNKTIVDIAKEVIYSGIMGGIIGIGGGAVSIPATQAFKSRATNTLVENGMTEEQANSLVQERIYGTEEQRQELLNIVNESAKELQIKNAKKKLMELGVKESKAQEMAYDLVVTPQEMGEDLVETLNKEADNDTLLNGSYEDDVKDFIEKEKVDIVAEAFDVKQELKDRFMTEGGVQEDEAEAAATLVENFTRTIYNETGETPREYIERKGLNVLDERYPADEDEVIDESELTEEEIARLDAKEQARMEEEDIPFYQESLDIARENEKLDAENPAYDGETININGVDKTVYNSDGERIAQSEAALRNFYNWFGDSKVVDKQGRPLVVYHGTNKKFDTFDKSKIGKKHKNLYQGKGFYFTSEYYEAQGYGKRLMPVYLKIENPALSDYNIKPENDGISAAHGVWVAFEPNQIKSTSNRGTYSESENIYYQSAFAGSRVDYDRPSLEAIGSGEGNQAHGWGLYYALDRDVAEGYRERSYSQHKWAGVQSLDQEFGEIKVNGKPFLDVYDVDIDRTLLETLLYKPYGTVEELLDKRIEQWENLSKKDDYPYKKYANDKVKAYKDLRNDLYENGMNYIKQDTGQVHEVDIPENPYLMDEQKTLGEQSSTVKKALKQIANEIGVKWDSRYDNGKYIYDNIANVLGSPKAASQMLEKHGVKGITYFGQQDGRCFVIFNPEDVKVIQKFYQGERVKRGSYNPKTRVINLFKEANRSTLIHELGHVFTMDYVKILEESGQTEKLAGFYEWLGINDISEATTETWEKMARGFETYIMEGQAPNVSTQNLFERLRQWLVGVYKDLKGKVIPPEEINDDVREFFDKMLSQDEEMPDITSLKGRTQDILKVIQAAQKGESISVNGLSIEDVKKLVKASRARLPRKPKTLEQDIRAQGGIDIQLAKSLGIYDEKKGNRSGFFKKDGAIKREDSLIEFLQDAGYLEQGETETYEQTAELQDKAIELVEKADKTYTPENQTIMEQRQTLETIASEAMAELSEKGIKEKELFTALKTIKSVNLQAVSKDELKYLKSQLKSLEKDYKKFMKNTLRNQRKDFTQKQNEMLDFIKAMPLTGEDKVKLLTRVKKAKFIDDFNRVAREVFNKGRELYENEQKKRYVTLIKKEIRKSKPTGAMKQRYDYENNKLFADLRKWNNLTQAQAQEELAKIEVQDDKTETDLIRIRFLNYKANGMDSSVELMEEVYNDIMNAKEAGRLAKGDIDVAKAVNRELLKRDVLDAIAQNDADKETFKTKFTNLYRRGLTNLYSMLNSISSKSIADRFQMETVVNNAEIRTYKHIEKLTNEILDMLNLKSKGQLLDRLGEMGQIIDNITDTEGRVRELSKLHILDIYNAMKNEKTRGNYIRSYGEEQLARVLRYLTPQDLMLADMLMEDVNTLYPETNKVYIENYGMDLKKVDNYWPATSEHQKETDLLGDVFSQQTIPSFQKERVRGAVTPIPRNAWSKYLKHVKQSIYMINTANKYKELADTFKSSRVKNAIQTKFGDGVYTELMAQIERLSLNGASQDLNYLETAFGAVLNNFVVAKIAVAPTVFVGQLTSITNYSESIKTGQFYKNFAEGLSHPKKTIDYMKKVSGDFLESRYKGGYSEAVSRVLSEAESVNKKKFRVLSTGTKYNVVNALTSWVRMGDIGAIIFGGYAQIKSNLDNGMSLEDAKKKFEFDTLRSQQSSNAASLSSFQQSKGFARMFLAFKNTQHQYLRKIADAIINYQRGEISSQQMGKIILNYAIIQTSLYVIAKNITKAALGLSGDDDDLTDGVIEQILVGSLDAIPILSDLLRYTYKRLTKQYAGGLVNMPGVDDIEKAINKLAKEEKDVYDYVDIISPLIEGTTSLPVQRFKGIVKKYSE